MQCDCNATLFIIITMVKLFWNYTHVLREVWIDIWVIGWYLSW